MQVVELCKVAVELHNALLSAGRLRNALEPEINETTPGVKLPVYDVELSPISTLKVVLLGSCQVS